MYILSIVSIKFRQDLHVLQNNHVYLVNRVH